jgi:O-antigen ligase
LDKITSHILNASFVILALMIPFSIAGETGAIFLGILAWLLALATVPAARQSAGRILKEPIFLASILLVLSALPSLFMSENFSRAFRDWKSYWLLVVFFMVAYNLRSLTMQKRLFWILFGSLMLSCVVALIQHYGGMDLGLFTIQPKHRPGGTLYPMTLAGILYQTIMLCFAVLMRERRFSWSFVILAAGVLIQFAVLLFTLTRGAYLALAGGLLVLLLLLRSKRALVGAVVLLGLLAAFVTYKPTDLDRTLSVPDLVQAPPDRNVRTRLVLWEISLELFKRHPVFGVGMGDYSIETDKLLAERKVTTTVDSHNIYLQTLATRGLFGFIPFVLFWLVLVRGLFRLLAGLQADSFGRYFVTGAIAATAAVLVGALTENNIDDQEVFIAYLFIVGLVMGYVNMIDSGIAMKDSLRKSRFETQD